MPPGFASLSRRPSKTDFDCANYSKTEWVVLYSGGRLRASARTDTTSVDPLPFSYERDPDRSGDRHVVQVSDGWLAGFDGGEFGGGLWWFGNAAKRPIRLRPPANAPVNSGDPFSAENVRGFARLADSLLVFMGLDHLTGRSGRVFAVRQAGGAWVLEPFVVLDASPAAWVIDGERVLVLTESGLWEALPGNRTKKLHDLDVGLQYPNSMAHGPDGTLYVGMRRYVLRLQPLGARWAETWFVQSNCARASIRDYDCQCIP